MRLIDADEIGLTDFEILECRGSYKTALEMILKKIEKAPTVTPQEPKTGHWIMSTDGYYRPICDKCGAHPWKGYIPTVEEATDVFKYCPSCGAKMVEPQESEG